MITIVADTLPAESWPDILQVVSGGGAAVALLAITWGFFRFLASERQSMREEREASAMRFQASLDTVVAGHERAVASLSEHLDDVRDSHVRIEAKVDQILSKVR